MTRFDLAPISDYGLRDYPVPFPTKEMTLKIQFHPKPPVFLKSSLSRLPLEMGFCDDLWVLKLA